MQLDGGLQAPRHAAWPAALVVVLPVVLGLLKTRSERRRPCSPQAKAPAHDDNDSARAKRCCGAQEERARAAAERDPLRSSTKPSTKLDQFECPGGGCATIPVSRRRQPPWSGSPSQPARCRASSSTTAGEVWGATLLEIAPRPATAWWQLATGSTADPCSSARPPVSQPRPPPGGQFVRAPC